MFFKKSTDLTIKWSEQAKKNGGRVNIDIMKDVNNLTMENITEAAFDYNVNDFQQLKATFLSNFQQFTAGVLTGIFQKTRQCLY